MTLSNFRLKRDFKNITIDKRIAAVDVTTGIFPWTKKTVQREIVRAFIGYWHFSDNGKFCPGYQAEELERSWDATH